MTVVARPIINRDQWLQWRKGNLNASQIPALFDAFPPTYKTTALRLHMQHRGVEFPDEDNAILRRGRWMEPSVAEAVRELRPDWQIEPARMYFEDAALRLGCTPDFFIHGDPRGLGILQCKTTAPSVWHRDWADGTDPPFHVRLQCLVECMLTNAAWGAIAVLLVDAFAMDCEIVEVERNSAVEAKICAAVLQFWADVEAGREPQPDFTKDAELIAKLSPHATPGLICDASGHNELPELLARRADLRAAIGIAETECKAIEAQVKHLMADAEILSGIPGWRITWKIEPRRGYTVPSSTPRVLHIRDQRPPEEEQS